MKTQMELSSPGIKQGRIENYVLGNWYSGQSSEQEIYDAVNGELIAKVSSDGIDFADVLRYGREQGRQLRNMTFQERGMMLKKLASYLMKRKEEFYDISFHTGATRKDSWIDIEGGFGNLFAYASLRKQLSGASIHNDGPGIDLSRGGPFMGQHLLIPKRGVAIHINAFNFPVWGMLEKCAVNWMAGVPALVKAASNTSYLAEAVVRAIVESKILPEGSLQFIAGSARGILDHVESQDVVTFTGSADTGRMLKSHERIISESVPFNMEADSLNCSVLGMDAKPGTPEFDLFIKEVAREMTVKCGQKCTAIRRIIVPEESLEDVQIALASRLSKVAMGNPRSENVRMGALVSKDQVEEVLQRIKDLSEEAEIVFEGEKNAIEAEFDRGAFLSPTLLRSDNPLGATAVHEVEAFGPVSTLMPYSNLEEASELARMGKGSLVSSICTNDPEIAREYVLEAGSHHGRILVLNRENARHSTGHGSPLPTLVHGGPGRAGGGEEMGGLRGLGHYMQRCAVQASPTAMTRITGVYRPGADVIEGDKHPFSYHFDDIEVGRSILTHKRTVTDSDIINFANLTWDHFYAHTDITSLRGSIFEKRAAHGYFLLAAAAGLFVHPNKGPVGANYGLDECRFLKPIYHNDTIQVRLTCKEKIDRDVKGREFPSGVVKWFEEIFDADGELVATATILTLVKKRSPFAEISRDYIEDKLAQLTENSKAEWGILEAQHMVEHMEYFYLLGMGDFEAPLSTPEKLVERYQESLWNYRPMPKSFDHPVLKKGELEDLRYDNLKEAKKALLKAFDRSRAIYKENPEALLFNPVFGSLDQTDWELLEQKHFHHHFSQFSLI
jgi:oxepin-CoA hydrolase/3-oxo-5,6-dehydrosuberyl-CoA semialdehyde dehydrogenase